MKRWNNHLILVALTSFLFIHSKIPCAENTMLSTVSITADKIIEKYRQACGGSALAEIKTETRKGTLVRGESGKVPFEIISKAPGKWFYNQVFAFGDQVSYGCDGMNAWVQDTKGISEISAQERLDLQVLLDAQAPLKLAEFYPEMTVKESKKIGENEFIIVRAKSKEGITTELEFDLQTGLLARAGDIYLEDYREVGKVKRPYRIFIGDDPGEEQLRMKMEIAEIVQDIDVADSIFKPPVCALPFKKAPLYTFRKDAVVSNEAMNACVGVYQHPTKPEVTYIVSRQGDHLMLFRTGWPNRFEIRPESELDYFVRFLNWEFHFVKDETGKIIQLEIGPDRAVKAMRIK